MTTIFGLDEDGDLPVVGIVLVTGVDAILEDVTTRLRFFRGEWFLDPDVGVPYFQRILGKTAGEATIRRELTAAVEQANDVDRVESISISHNRASRHATVSLRALTTTGEPVEATVGV